MRGQIAQGGAGGAGTGLFICAPKAMWPREPPGARRALTVHAESAFLTAGLPLRTLTA